MTKYIVVFSILFFFFFFTTCKASEQSIVNTYILSNNSNSNTEYIYNEIPYRPTNISSIDLYCQQGYTCTGYLNLCITTSTTATSSPDCESPSQRIYYNSDTYKTFTFTPPIPIDTTSTTIRYFMAVYNELGFKLGIATAGYTYNPHPLYRQDRTTRIGTQYRTTLLYNLKFENTFVPTSTCSTSTTSNTSTSIYLSDSVLDYFNFHSQLTVLFYCFIIGLLIFLLVIYIFK